jgi:antitoxin (DNA-binding transcriptional repressor) of toxin-antitoxin stability system
VRELRQNASKYLARVKAGETIQVTERGKLVALVTPPRPGQTALERLIAEGKVIPAKAPFVLPKRGRPLPGHPTGSEAIQEQKEERLL